MKRLHIHVGVEQLDNSIKFYNALFGVEPTKIKEDYAKWVLTEPSVNFAISTHAKQGIDHLGIQVDQVEELEELRTRIQNADMAVFDEGVTECCYARSDKSWVKDPSGVAWEAYQTMADAHLYTGKTVAANDSTDAKPCCVPDEKATMDEPKVKAACC